MDFIDLPEEVLIIIIRLLDAKSMHNVYNTCKYLRQILSQHGVVKKFNMCRNTMGTARSLKLDFFKDISRHLQELNMSGIHDLTKTSLLSVIKRLKCLKSLDISYTNITIIDFMEIYKLCPTIKCICLNFVFGKLGMTKISHNLILECKNMFKNFDKIHFVGSTGNLLNDNLPLYILSECNLKALKFSASECNYAFTTNHIPLNFEELQQNLQFNYCNICILNWREQNQYYQNLNTIPFFSHLDFKNYEFIVTTRLHINNCNVFTSPLFKPFFNEHFNIEAKVINQLEKPLFGNVSIMLWNKNCTKFDDTFFNKLYDEIKQYYPAQFSVDTGPVSSKLNWFYTLSKIQADEDTMKIHAPHAPKRRMAHPNVVLNYDSLFYQKDKFMLSIVFQDHLRNAAALSNDCDYLRKITFLSLTGIVRYSIDFFNILFSCCISLETLDVESTIVSSCTLPISRSLHLSQCLKNFRLIDKKIDFNALVTSLSKCSTLENIHIIEDKLLGLCTLADASSIVENCDYLYYLYIEAPISENEQLKHTRLLNKTITKCGKYHVNTVIQPKADNARYRYHYDPYIEIFYLSPIKQL
ncbi:uncharacterized protein LOC115451791 [Manduca sexta]|nr:uncharacterized protein LOC115451791 [Manduca sexta]